MGVVLIMGAFMLPLLASENGAVSIRAISQRLLSIAFCNRVAPPSIRSEVIFRLYSIVKISDNGVSWLIMICVTRGDISSRSIEVKYIVR